MRDVAREVGKTSKHKVKWTKGQMDAEVCHGCIPSEQHAFSFNSVPDAFHTVTHTV